MLKTVYDAEGKPHTVEGVDAREYLASGTYFSSPPEAAPAAPPEPPPPPPPEPPAPAPVAKAPTSFAKK